MKTAFAVGISMPVTTVSSALTRVNVLSAMIPSLPLMASVFATSGYTEIIMTVYLVQMLFCKTELAQPTVLLTRCRREIITSAQIVTIPIVSCVRLQTFSVVCSVVEMLKSSRAPAYPAPAHPNTSTMLTLSPMNANPAERESSMPTVHASTLMDSPY